MRRDTTQTFYEAYCRLSDEADPECEWRKPGTEVALSWSDEGGGWPSCMGPPKRFPSAEEARQQAPLWHKMPYWCPLDLSTLRIVKVTERQIYERVEEPA